MRFIKLCLWGLAATLALPALAQSMVIVDAIKLAQAGLSEDVIVAWAEKQDAGPVSAGDVIRLTEAKVPAKAISALIRSVAKSVAANYTVRSDINGNQMTVQRSREAVTYVERSSTSCVQSSNFG